MANHTSDEIARFKEVVMDGFAVSDQRGVIRGYADYLDLPATERSDDEADVVDTRFTMRVLDWLGFTEGQYTYNRRQTGRPTNRPDFVAHGAVGTAFIWEDKRTGEAFDSESHVKQLARYAAGTPGYAVWSNAHRIIALRFDPNGNYNTLADVNLLAVFGSQKVFPEELARQLAGLQLFFLLFRRDRFATFDDLVKAICVTKLEFLERAVPLASETAQHEFIKGAGQALDHLRVAALSRIHAAIEHRILVDKRREDLHAEWEQETAKLTGADPVMAKAIRAPLQAVSAKLGDLDDGQVAAVETAILAAEKGRMPKVLADILDTWKQRTARIDAAVHATRLLAGPEIYIRDAFIVWKDRQPDPELATLEVFAQQAAYVFFVRMLLARTLEDKGLIENRIASDGGFERWREIVTFYFRESGISIHAESFIHLLAERVAAYYQHFFHQPVFDWFVPDDYMLVETLEFLNRYNFQHVQSDILGFTYEEYIERVARNKKGHFLTRPSVVGHMLDLAGYEGHQVIGRRVLDPACGSGSFLVTAARRYRKALVSAVASRAGLDPDDLLSREDAPRLEVAERYVEALTTLLYGMDIDPFSCYLAELNLFVCGLEDIHYLWKKKAFSPIERFHIYNTDSLNLPTHVLNSSTPQPKLSGESELLREDRAVYRSGALSLADELVDEGHGIKAKADEYSDGFYYVVSNPPYITRKQHPELDSRYRQRPFYAEALSGDMNTYLLFLRLGLYYLADGGVICYIVPLTILGDQSASAVRRLLTAYRVRLSSLVRFYSGNVLFPGVDQATAIVCATGGEEAERPVLVAGGYTVAEAERSSVEVPLSDVISVTPRATPWHGAWLVSPVGESYRVWDHVRRVSSGCLGDLWPDDEFDVRQGDVNATYVKPLQVESHTASDIPLFKGDNVFSYAPLPESPAAWARIPASTAASRSGPAKALAAIRDLKHTEFGVALREVARLNTRERLNATSFSRGHREPLAFTHGVWRFVAKGPSAGASSLHILTGLLNSRVTAYLLNLFSTNNNVLMNELARIPTPPRTRLAEAALLEFAGRAASIRLDLENRFVARFGMKLPDRDGRAYLPPSGVLATASGPKVLLSDLELRGELTVKPGAVGKVASLLESGLLRIGGNECFRRAVRLLLDEHGSRTWAEIRSSVHVPEPAACEAFLKAYDRALSEATRLWSSFEEARKLVDDVVCDWYGFDDQMRDAIREGLPWARRKRE